MSGYISPPVGISEQGMPKRTGFAFAIVKRGFNTILDGIPAKATRLRLFQA